MDLRLFKHGFLRWQTVKKVQLISILKHVEIKRCEKGCMLKRHFTALKEERKIKPRALYSINKALIDLTLLFLTSLTPCEELHPLYEFFYMSQKEFVDYRVLC